MLDLAPPKTTVIGFKKYKQDRALLSLSQSDHGFGLTFLLGWHRAETNLEIGVALQDYYYYYYYDYLITLGYSHLNLSLPFPPSTPGLPAPQSEGSPSCRTPSGGQTGRTCAAGSCPAAGTACSSPRSRSGRSSCSERLLPAGGTTRHVKNVQTCVNGWRR